MLLGSSVRALCRSSVRAHSHCVAALSWKPKPGMAWAAVGTLYFTVSHSGAEPQLTAQGARSVVHAGTRYGCAALRCTALHCTALHCTYGIRLCSAVCSRSEKTSLLVLREQIVAASAIELGRRTETAKLRQEVLGTRSHVAVAQQGVRGHCAAE